MLYLSTNADKVFVEDPIVQSRASYLLLRDQMQRLVMEEWETFRNEIFDEFEALHGSLICHYCGAENLVREILDPCNKAQLKTLATIDHIVALANGGLKWDKKNCAVACHPCNNHKKDKSNYVRTQKR